MTRPLVLLLLVLATDAVAQGVPPAMVHATTMPPIYEEAATQLQIQSFNKPDQRADVAYGFMANKTRLVASPGTPLQVVYTSPDGLVVLWFPGPGVQRSGRWSIEERRQPLTRGGVAVKTSTLAGICFDYSGGVPNLFGPESQRGRQCSPLDGVRGRTLDRKVGDVFGLSGGAPRGPLGEVAARKLDDLKRRF